MRALRNGVTGANEIDRPGELVTSEDGVRIGAKVWGEIIDALENVRPDIRSLVAFRDSLEASFRISETAILM